ncbi:site-specific integrase [Cellulomonas sp. NPDC089187]|uniref:tyrosine-type recombinase/integrase n=1 Tax=Cellulomonas sp. NPDC089187 TaxID=3154970 RepID=UPI0034152F99
MNVADQLPVIPPALPRPKPAAPELVAFALRDPDKRVRLMVRLGNDVGLRRGEVAAGHSDDLFQDLDGWSLRVHGKGSREGTVPLPDDLARALRALGPGYFFPGRDNGHLSARWVGKLVKRALGGEATMHQLRHLCATQLHQDTKDLRMVQELLRHASLTTTQRYVAVPNGALRAAVSARSADWSQPDRAA